MTYLTVSKRFYKVSFCFSGFVAKMVKNIDEKENSFQDELQEDVLDSNNNPSGIYLLWQKLTQQKIAICKCENV